MVSLSLSLSLTHARTHTYYNNNNNKIKVTFAVISIYNVWKKYLCQKETKHKVYKLLKIFLYIPKKNQTKIAFALISHHSTKHQAIYSYFCSAASLNISLESLNSYLSTKTLKMSASINSRLSTQTAHLHIPKRPNTSCGPIFCIPLKHEDIVTNQMLSVGTVSMFLAINQ
jgi:hypothetical protein